MKWHLHMMLVAGAVLQLMSSPAIARSRSPAEVVQQGQWLEVRGTYDAADHAFRPNSLELVDPLRYEELVGTIEDYDPDAGQFSLLGRSVQLHPKTEIARIKTESLDGARVKVEGYFRGERRFSAREIRPRGPGRDRIIGRVDSVLPVEGGTEFTIMNFTILAGPDVQVRHEDDIATYAITDTRVQAIVDRDRDEENLFGRGIQVSENTRVAGQFQVSGVWEDNFNLRDLDPEDVDETLTSVKGRLIYAPSRRFFAVVGYTVRRLWRDDESRGDIDIRNRRFDETYVYWLDAFVPGFDVQIGRIKFDERREFLYDKNLDGPRLIWTRSSLRAELSLTTVVTDGNAVEENTTNTMLYVSNNNDDRHLAGYVIHRDFDYPQKSRRTHLGFRMHGRWLTDQKVWLEMSHMQGKEGQTDTRGWALDIGSTWRFHDNFALTGGFAMATGDDPSSPIDNTYRQTGFHDNNDKFAGVTSFRFYGELTDPELANLEIFTAGLGWLPRRRVSLDLVAHSYRQNERSRRLVDMQIDRRPNGIDKELGTELDLVFGWRTNWKWDLEVVAGWFNPGKAFNEADEAYFGKVQFRYRM